MAEDLMNYVLGRGKVYFDRFAPGTKISQHGARYLGSTQEFSTTSATDVLDHYSSEGGLKVKDASVDLQVNRSGTFNSDNINGSNLAMFFTGDLSNVTQTAATAIEDTRKLYKDAYFQVGQSSANPAGAFNITNFKVQTTAATPVVIAQSGNYTIDLATGQLYILPDAPGITDATEYELVFDTTNSTREVVISKNQSVYGSIRFVADNAVGKNRDYFLPYVKLSPGGDFALKGDDWQMLPFSMEILKLDALTEPMYITTRGALVTP